MAGVVAAYKDGSRWHVRFPGQTAKDFVASVGKDEKALASQLLEHLRSLSPPVHENAALRKLCQAKLAELKTVLPPVQSATAAEPEPKAEETTQKTERPVPEPQIEVSCELCWEDFDDGDHTPLVSKCGHTFCKACLKRIIGANQRYSCPTCRKSFRRDECSKNYWIIRNLDALLQRARPNAPKRPAERKSTERTPKRRRTEAAEAPAAPAASPDRRRGEFALAETETSADSFLDELHSSLLDELLSGPHWAPMTPGAGELSSIPGTPPRRGRAAYRFAAGNDFRLPPTPPRAAPRTPGELFAIPGTPPRGAPFSESPGGQRDQDRSSSRREED
eukprot:s424_g30.t2